MTQKGQAAHDVVYREGDRGAYGIVNHLIAPRAIAWVATRSADGVDNLAPHSYVTVASTDPLVVAITSVGHKDTLRNVQATGEFVVCGVSRSLREQANATSAPFPADVSEFDQAQVTREPSLTVSVARVRQAPFSIECRLRDTVPVGNATIILGDVSCILVDPRAVKGGRVSTAALDLVGRGGADDWFGLGERWAMPRAMLSDESPRT